MAETVPRLNDAEYEAKVRAELAAAAAGELGQLSYEANRVVELVNSGHFDREEAIRIVVKQRPTPEKARIANTLVLAAMAVGFGGALYFATRTLELSEVAESLIRGAGVAIAVLVLLLLSRAALALLTSPAFWLAAVLAGVCILLAYVMNAVYLAAGGGIVGALVVYFLFLRPRI